MKNKMKLLSVVSLVIFLSGCASPDPHMVETIAFFYNTGLSIGYLLILSIFFPVKNKGTLLIVGLVLVSSIMFALMLLNIFYDYDFLKISLPYRWFLLG